MSVARHRGLVGLGCLLAALAFAPARAASLRGLILDRGDAPVAGATVRVIAAGSSFWELEPGEPWVAPEVATTDDDGRFRLEGPTPERLRVRVEAAGRAPLTLDDIPAGASLTLHLEPGGERAGRVVDLAGAPVADAKVVACDEGALAFGESACRVATGDEDGGFRLDGLADGPLLVQGRAPGRAASDVVRLDGPAGAPTDLVLRLEPGAWIRGALVDQDGRARPGVRIEAHVAGRRDAPFAASRQGDWPLVTEADGRFVVPGVPAGQPVRLRVRRADRPALIEGPWTLAAGGDLGPLRLVDPDPAAMVWQLFEPSGAPVETTVEVRVAPHVDGRSVAPGRGTPLDDVRPDPTGAYRLDRLEPGRFDVWLVPDGWLETAREDVRLEPGLVTELGPLLVEPGLPVEGRVTDRDRRPLADARIAASYRGPAGTVTRDTRSEDDGGYRLVVHPDATSLTLTAFADGHASASRRDVEPGDLDVDFALEPQGSAVGVVVRPSGAPVPGYTIRVHAESGEDTGLGDLKGGPPTELRTVAIDDDEGRFELTDLPPGRYTFEFRAPDIAPALRAGVSIASGEEADLGEIELSEGLRLRGRVVLLADGAPMASVKVGVQESRLPIRGGPSSGWVRITDGDGRFEIRGLPPGRVTVTATHPDYAEASAERDLRPEVEPAEVLLRLSRGGRVVGTVRDVDGAPRSDVRIVVASSMIRLDEGFQGRTGADGRYAIEKVPPGSYQVVRLGPGSGTLDLQSREAVVEEGRTVVVDFDESARIRLSGTVLRRGVPMPHAGLLFLPGDGSLDFAGMRSTDSDAEGRYEIGLDHPGTYRVAIQGVTGKAGGDSGTIDIVVPDEPRVTRDLVLRDGLLAGRVVDDDGQPVGGAQITARPTAAPPEDLTALQSARSDDAGRYRLETLPDGEYLVAASAPGYQVATAGPVPVSADAPATGVDLTLRRGRTMRGRVIDPNGRGVPGAMVLAAPSGRLDIDTSGSTQTDVNGGFRMTAPGDGPLDVTAIGAGWAPARTFGYTVPEDAEAAELVLRTERGATLRVAVTDASGRGVPAARVRVTPEPPYLGAELAALLRPAPPTGSDGTLRVDFLAPGRYRLDVAEGTATATARVELTEGAETAVELRLVGTDASRP